MKKKRLMTVMDLIDVLNSVPKLEDSLNWTVVVFKKEGRLYIGSMNGIEEGDELQSDEFDEVVPVYYYDAEAERSDKESEDNE